VKSLLLSAQLSSASSAHSSLEHTHILCSVPFCGLRSPLSWLRHSKEATLSAQQRSHPRQAAASQRVQLRHILAPGSYSLLPKHQSVIIALYSAKQNTIFRSRLLPDPSDVSAHGQPKFLPMPGRAVWPRRPAIRMDLGGIGRRGRVWARIGEPPSPQHSLCTPDSTSHARAVNKARAIPDPPPSLIHSPHGLDWMAIVRLACLCGGGRGRTGEGRSHWTRMRRP
jgi:hypothetical protein